jgi:hypothetical protein
LEVQRSSGGRPEKNSSHDGTSYQRTLKNNQLARSTASRWQQLAAIPEEEFERSVNATKEVVGDVTTASLLSQAAAKRAVSRMPDDETPVVIPPDKPQRIGVRVYEVSTAIQALAETDVDPARLQWLMDDFQWYHIDESLDSALVFLSSLKKHWRPTWNPKT